MIARDKRIRTKPAEVALLREHGMRVFWLAGKRDLATWDALVRIARRWTDIERALQDLGGGPWFCAVNDNRVKEMTLL